MKTIYLLMLSIILSLPGLLIGGMPLIAQQRTAPQAGRFDYGLAQSIGQEPKLAGSLVITAQERLSTTVPISGDTGRASARTGKHRAAITRPALLTSPTDLTSLNLAMAQAIVSDPTIITFADFVTQPIAASAAVFDTPLTFFPTEGTGYAVLSTGRVNSLPHPQTFASTNLSGGNVRGDSDFDVTIWRIGLNVPADVNCLALDFQFLSEEYPDFVGGIYNDAFMGELDQSTWTTADSDINAPRNFLFDAEGNPITINSVVGLSPANGQGTAFDGGEEEEGGATGLLTARTPITPGLHTLYLSIFDQGDHLYDSAVLVDKLILFAAADGDCRPGVAPPTQIYLPILFKNMVFAPDLVVDSLNVTGNMVTVAIKNIGNAPVLESFWLDVYIEPDSPPTGVNQHWWQLADQGLVWGVTKSIAVNEVLTLTVGDPYYSAFHSHFEGSLAPGTPIWAQVDSVNLNTTYGGVLESHEIVGGAYNNITNTLSSTVLPPLTPLPDAGSEPPSGQLPLR